MEAGRPATLCRSHDVSFMWNVLRHWTNTLIFVLQVSIEFMVSGWPMLSLLFRDENFMRFNFELTSFILYCRSEWLHGGWPFCYFLAPHMMFLSCETCYQVSTNLFPYVLQVFLNSWYLAGLWTYWYSWVLHSCVARFQSWTNIVLFVLQVIWASLYLAGLHTHGYSWVLLSCVARFLN